MKSPQSSLPHSRTAANLPGDRRRWPWIAAATVMAAVLALGGLFAYGLQYYQTTPREAAYKVLDRLDLDWPWLHALLAPPPRYGDPVLDGRLRDAHPRILLPQLAGWHGLGTPPLMLERDFLYKDRGLSAPDACGGGGGVMSMTACWITTGNEQPLQRLLQAMRDFRLTATDASGRYGNGWHLAFAYDLARLHPDLSLQDQAHIEATLRRSLTDTLAVLDRDSSSLWHGRTSLAAGAWLCAVVLDPDDPRNRSLIRRAQAHFLDVITALEITEGWPEGYNYWIQNRGLVLALAGAAYLNGLEDSHQARRVRHVLRRVGYWHIHGTRPDNRFEGLGDEGSRVDLKDETRRVIDVLAQVLQDPVLATYSHYLGGLHGRQSYYRNYRWGFRLFNDPGIIPLPGDGLTAFEGVLPRAELFGRHGLNLAYLRSDWSPDATFISFRAGASLSHHGHYDAGHFSLFKGAPLAINSSTYSGIINPHRLHYAIRSVAKNTLLILRPGERVRPNRFFDTNVAGGGQRITLPTGAAITGTRNWLDNLNRGLHLEGGRLETFDHRPGLSTYLRADLTAAYNNPTHDTGGTGGKVAKVVRELVYLAREDRLLVHDRVLSTEASYVKKWLLHTVNKPQVWGLTLLAGKLDNGILESASRDAVIQNGRAYLALRRLYPRDGLLRLVGGPGYRYYVETDGDDSDLDGRNFHQGAAQKPWFDVGNWRIEIQPRRPRHRDRFLVALSPSLDTPRQDDVARLTLEVDHAAGVVTDRNVVLFLDPGAESPLALELPEGPRRLHVLGLPPGTRYSLEAGGRRSGGRVNDNGTSVLDLAGLSGQAVLRW